MTKTERLADVATGVSWTGAITAFVANALPIVQLLAGIAAIVCSIFAARYYYKRTKH